MATAIKDITNPAVYLAIKRVCDYLVNSAWRTSGDFDFDYTVAKTRKYEADIQKLANIDLDIGWGDKKEEVSPGAWETKHIGDFNPWYDGILTLEELLESIEPLADELENTEPKYTAELEFLHYHEALQATLPKPERTQPASIDMESLHPKIREHCQARFNDQHYSDAILAAYKVVLNEIKDVTGIQDQDGKPLVERAFSLSNPIIKLNPLTSPSDKDEQQGFMLLISGAAVGIRNPKAHDLVMQEDRAKTLSYLAFASLLMQRIDERYSPKEANDEQG